MKIERLEGTNEAGEVSREYTIEVRAHESRENVIRVRASTTELDSYETIFAQDWDTSAFKRNPVILFQHDAWGTLPIARGENVEVEGQAGAAELMLDFVFDTEDPFASEVLRKYKAGFMHAVSIRGRPGKVTRRDQLPEDHYAFGERGLFYSKNRLIEVSAVILGGNSEAVVTQRQQGPAPTAAKQVITHLRSKPDLMIEVLRAALKDPEIQRTISSIALAGPVEPEADPDFWMSNLSDDTERGDDALPWLQN